MKDKTILDRRRYQGEWHLDKRVVVSVIGTVAMLAVAFSGQAVMLFRWGSNMQTSVEKMQEANAVNNKRLDALETKDNDRVRLVERVVRVETMLEGMHHTLNKIDDNIESRMRGRTGR